MPFQIGDFTLNPDGGEAFFQRSLDGARQFADGEDTGAGAGNSKFMVLP